MSESSISGKQDIWFNNQKWAEIFFHSGENDSVQWHGGLLPNCYVGEGYVSKAVTKKTPTGGSDHFITRNPAEEVRFVGTSKSSQSVLFVERATDILQCIAHCAKFTSPCICTCSDEDEDESESPTESSPRIKMLSPREPPPDPIHSVDDDTMDITGESFHSALLYQLPSK